MKEGRLHIAMLLWSYWPGHEGGAERQCRKLIPCVAAQGLEIVVCTARTRWCHRRQEAFADHEIVRLGCWVPLLMALRRRLDGMVNGLLPGAAGNAHSRARLRESVSFWIGLPLTLGARMSFLLDFWWWLRRTKRRPDVIHVHESSWMAGLAAFLARRYRIPVLAKTAVFPAWDVLGYDVPLRRALSEARRGCRFVALASYLADDLIAHGVSQEQIFIVPNGVEIPEWRGERPPSKEVLFVANFSQSVEQKAFDVLLTAWSHVVQKDPSARLLLLGGGDCSQWEDMAKALQLQSSCHFIGWVPDPAEYYRRAALLVLPSRSEGMSNALLEAQSWALPCVVSDIPGNRAVVEDGRNGLVVPVGDDRELAEAVLRFLGDIRLREAMGGSAREKMVEQFSLDSVAGRLCGIYRKLVTTSSEGDGA